MNIIRWNPSRGRDLDLFRTEMDRLFDSFWTRPLPATDLDVFTPPVDIEETDDGFVFRADVPGMTQKDVKVTVTGDTLTLRGERKREARKAEGNVHRTERVHGVFERSFTLPAPVRPGDVKATYRDGVLEIRVPKAEEARVREVEVQIG